MGYAWNRVCYPTTAKALAAFVLDIPGADSGGINTFTTAPTINGSGVITWSISNRPLSDAVATTRTGTTKLPACTEATTLLPSAYTTQEMLMVIAMVILFAIGFRTGKR